MAFEITEGSGKNIAADVYGAAHNVSSTEQVQFVALATGTLGALALATTGNPLPIKISDGTDVAGVGTGTELFAATGGGATSSVASGAANTVVKASAGRLCRILVTTAGSGSGNVLVYDNASTNSGTVIGIVPATIAIGTFYNFEMPAANGITVQNVASGPVLTVSYF